MKKILLLSAFALLCSCSKNLEKDPYLGAWQLVSASFYSLPERETIPPLVFPETGTNLVFEFKEQGVLSVYGQIEDVNDWLSNYGLLREEIEIFSLFEKGEGLYAYTAKSRIDNLWDLTIDEKTWYLTLSNESTLVIGLIGGSSYTLKKVKE